MAPQVPETFATEIDSEVLSAVRKIAQSEGRQVHALIHEALVDLIEKRKHAAPRSHIMEVYLASHEKFGTLYKKLAE